MLSDGHEDDLEDVLDGGTGAIEAGLSDEFIAEWGVLLQEELCPDQD